MGDSEDMRELELYAPRSMWARRIFVEKYQYECIKARLRDLDGGRAVSSRMMIQFKTMLDQPSFSEMHVDLNELIVEDRSPKPIPE